MASIPTPPKMIQTTAYQPLSHHARPLATGAPASAGLAAAVQACEHVRAPGLVAVLVQRPVMAAQSASHRVISCLARASRCSSTARQMTAFTGTPASAAACRSRCSRSAGSRTDSGIRLCWLGTGAVLLAVDPPGDPRGDDGHAGDDQPAVELLVHGYLAAVAGQGRAQHLGDLPE